MRLRTRLRDGGDRTGPAAPLADRLALPLGSSGRPRRRQLRTARTKTPGPPKWTTPAWCKKRTRGTATERDKTRLPTLAGARGGFRRAPEPVRRLAALHLQSPIKHVNQVRTTSFLWSGK